ncbi:MAG: LysR family transcriptional regulator [Kofleriaceae bacterium]
MDRLDAMRAFVTVAELRGFAPAARRLGLSAPSVTRLVAGLEHHLAIRLLQRTSRAVALTDAGARYLDRARRILGDVAEAEATARAERTLPSGRFVVAASRTFGRREVAPLLARFLAAHPTVVGHLDLGDRNVNLIDEGVDLAVRIGVLEDSSLTVRRVGATRRVTVASPAYLTRSPRLRSPDDLARHRVIHFAGVSAAPEWRFHHRGHDHRVPIRPAFITNSAEAAIAHAELAGGVTMVLAYQAAPAIAAGRLRVVLPRWEPPPLPIQLVYPSARLVSANVRAFIDLVVATARWQFVDV